MTRPDRESRFDDVDLTALTIVELEDYLSKIVDRHVIIPDPFFARAYELRIADVQAHVQRAVAIRNRRETERQEALLPVTGPAAADARPGDVGDDRLDELIHWTSGAGMPDTLRALVELKRRRAAQAASAERVREAEAEARAERTVCAERIANLQARVAELEAAGAIADRVVEQPTAPQPGHVCPVPYGLGPDDVDALSELAVHAELVVWPRAREALDKILAAHRPPDPAVGPLPEVIACGTEGCVSSIKKSYLPSGWLLCEGTWRCPRCKVVATTEAS